MQGGNIVIGEIVKLKHIGTGKFLCVEDEKDLGLNNTSNKLSCLFIIKSDNAQKKEMKYSEEFELDASGGIRSNQ
jgi:hypothetical protein